VKCASMGLKRLCTQPFASGCISKCARRPLIEAPAEPQESVAAWVVVESATDVVSAARAATSRMIDLLMNRWGMSAIHAYLLTSVTMKLRLSQVVNEPMFTVSAAIGKDVLPVREMFWSGNSSFRYQRSGDYRRA